MYRTKEANFPKSIFLCACPRLHPMNASDWRQPPKSWAWVYALPSHHSSASVLHDRLWCDTLLCRGTSYGQSLSDARCPRVAGVVWLPDSIGRFTRRYYSKKAGYTGMKLICSLFISNFNSNSCWTALISLRITLSDITLHSWCRSALRHTILPQMSWPSL